MFERPQVDAYLGDVDLKAWVESPSLELELGPPHDRTYIRLAKSPFWVIFLRVLLPLAALRTTLKAYRFWGAQTRPESVVGNFLE